MELIDRSILGNGICACLPYLRAIPSSASQDINFSPLIPPVVFVCTKLQKKVPLPQSLIVLLLEAGPPRLLMRRRSFLISRESLAAYNIDFISPSITVKALEFNNIHSEREDSLGGLATTMFQASFSITSILH